MKYFSFLIVCTLVLVSVFSCHSSLKPNSAEQLSMVQKNITPKFVFNSSDILYVNDGSGNLELWKLSKNSKPQQISTHKQKISDLQIARDGTYGVFAVDSQSPILPLNSLPFIKYCAVSQLHRDPKLTAIGPLYVRFPCSTMTSSA